MKQKVSDKQAKLIEQHGQSFTERDYIKYVKLKKKKKLPER